MYKFVFKMYSVAISKFGLVIENEKTVAVEWRKKQCSNGGNFSNYLLSMVATPTQNFKL